MNKLKLSELYEEIARANGYKDWNTLCGMENQSKIQHCKDIVRAVWKSHLKTAREQNASAQKTEE